MKYIFRPKNKSSETETDIIYETEHPLEHDEYNWYLINKETGARMTIKKAAYTVLKTRVVTDEDIDTHNAKQDYQLMLEQKIKELATLKIRNPNIKNPNIILEAFRGECEAIISAIYGVDKRIEDVVIVYSGGEEAGWKNYFDSLDKIENKLRRTLARLSIPSSKTPGIPLLKMGEAGKEGKAGSGGSIMFISEVTNISPSARISADGGDYIDNSNGVHSQNTSSGNNSPIQNNFGNDNINNLTNIDIDNAFNKIKSQLSEHVESVNREVVKDLLNELQVELKKEEKDPGEITILFTNLKKISFWVVGKIIEGTAGALIMHFIPPALLQGIPINNGSQLA